MECYVGLDNRAVAHTFVWFPRNRLGLLIAWTAIGYSPCPSSPTIST
jgi:hypothetical protein